MNILTLILCWLILSGGVLLQSDRVAADTRTAKNSLSPEVTKMIDKKVTILNEYLGDEAIQKAIDVSNQSHKNSTQAEIVALDNKWRSEKGVTDFVKPYLVNPCSKRLLNLQDEDEDFLEVFITNIKGLNVCQTNKTSDLYQADEEWWQDCFAEGKGQLQYGDVEYDESAGSKAASAYVPVYHDKQLVGVAKAVIDIASVKQ